MWYLELAALASLAALLVVLAVLQYRWLGTLSRRDAESQRAAVATALGSARAELERVLAAVHEDLRALAPEGVFDPAALRRDDFRRLAREPAVASAFWIGRDPERTASRVIRLTDTGDVPGTWAELLQAAPQWAQSLALRGAPPVAPPAGVPWISAVLRHDGASSPGVLLAPLDRAALQGRLDRDAVPGGVRLRLDQGLDLTADRSAASIARSVDALRRRNLLLSGGILSLLAASAGLLWLVSRRAALLSRERLELVAGISHELRTPVAVIRTAAENLSDGVVGTETAVREYGRLISDHARRLQRMVEQALDLSRAARHTGELTSERADLQRVIRTVVERTATLWPDLDVRGVERLARLPPVAVAPDDLEIVVGNLLANSGRYAEDERWAELEAVATGNRLRLSVTNPAQPPSPAELVHLFKPFFRGRRARELDREGSGLGLMLVRAICERYGGQASARTDSGSVTLVVELPL